jgi:hypothetical protein
VTFELATLALQDCNVRERERERERERSVVSPLELAILVLRIAK